MQQLNAEIIIPVPDDLILVKKVEYETLKEQSALGSWLPLKWFKEKTGIKRNDDLNKWILLPFQEELDLNNGGFVHYPEVQGDPWKFLKNPTERWLENNIARVYQFRGQLRKEVS
ncbi:DUF771 domain-containing protein [Loigolactobacillus zhaoyuanensis]|uniref:DUF771 domain-containing protein n=1 Tax=Loigolactobacillus zhaoyuanensis TaxID=2486017 RepID=A0ABW8UBB6_9LACO